jgi:starch phosphorylase
MIPEANSRTVAYFSMEIALHPGMPTYSGGLGVLAGDSLRAAADLGLPMVAVSLLHRKGYFSQQLDVGGRQTESAAPWSPIALLDELQQRISVTIQARPVRVRLWRFRVMGISGRHVPVYLLDTDLPENGEDRVLTDELYGGDARYRLCQEALLGMGGIAALDALGYRGIDVYHMNEGHSALLVLALLEREMGGRPLEQASDADVEAVRRRCVFTVHTPVEAGHDRFPVELVEQVLGGPSAAFLARKEFTTDGVFNMTHLAVSFSRFTNAVSVRHREVTRQMLPGRRIACITNGVNAATWVSPPFQRLFDRHIPVWRADNTYLRNAMRLPLEEVQEAHAEAKTGLMAALQQRTGCSLDPDAFTVGFARRMTAYKRAGLLFSDPDRLRQIARRAGALQVVLAGKSHPKDDEGKAIIRRLFSAAEALRPVIPVIFVEDYDMAVAGHLVAGADLWLNNPLKPLEASGTSGMKAALNGVPSLSVLDGWWLEGHVEGVTGWSIGDDSLLTGDEADDVSELYDKLERVILPLYYRQPVSYAEVGRAAIALNGSHFNAQRMMWQYARNAYASPGEGTAP